MNELEVYLHKGQGSRSNFGANEGILGFAQIPQFVLSVSAGVLRRFGVVRLVCCVLVGAAAGVAGAQSVPLAGAGVAERLAADLQWTQAEREARFAAMGKLFPENVIRHGAHVRRLAAGRPMVLPLSGGGLRARMERDRLAGVLVLQHGAVRVEQYGLGAGAATRWTSFSVAKSITSTLVGVEVRRGWIGGVDDAVTAYLPELRGSAYDGVTVRQLLTMSSGVRWVEAYDAPDSDNVRLYRAAVPAGAEPVVEYMRRLPRAHAPGTVWNYSTGEADLAGVLVRRVLARRVLARRVAAAHAGAVSLSSLLSESVWTPFGMERDAAWIADGGREFGGSGVSATLRDYGRFGLFALGGGAGAVPTGWFAQATRAAFSAGADGRGYGMGWWTFPGGSYAALGIFGQSVWVDPRRDLVVVMVGAWPHATDASLAASRGEIWSAMQAAVDAER